MSIENSLERIADALEVIAGNAGKSSSSTEASEAAKPSGGKSKTASSKSKSGKKSSDTPTKDDVKAALKGLQKATSASTARQLLADVGGAKTLTDLDESKYQAVIDEQS